VAFLVAFLVGLLIPALVGPVVGDPTACLITDQEVGGFESLRACHTNPCTAGVSSRPVSNSRRIGVRFLGCILVGAASAGVRLCKRSRSSVIHEASQRPSGCSLRNRHSHLVGGKSQSLRVSRPYCRIWADEMHPSECAVIQSPLDTSPQSRYSL
jgi:hypothetical protein